MLRHLRQVELLSNSTEMHEIDRVFTKYPFFGSRQIAAYLPQSGFSAGRHRVRRLMNLMGLQAVYKGPNTR